MFIQHTIVIRCCDPHNRCDACEKRWVAYITRYEDESAAERHAERLLAQS